MVQIIQPEGLMDTRQRGYSQARIQNGELYISGIASREGDWVAYGDDIETQTRRVFAILERVLTAVDRDLSDVAKVTTYLTEMRRDHDAYLEVWNEVFEEGPYPCHTLLGIDELAVEGFLVEVDAEVPL